MSPVIPRYPLNQISGLVTCRLRRGLALLLVGWIAILGGCADGGSEVSTSDTVAQQRTGGSGGGSGYTIDMDAIFPQGPGRNLVLNNCQNCHTWVPILILQMNEQEWDRWSREHRQRVEGLVDDEFSTLLSYLKVNFNPDTPVPELPPALLEAWTTY
jgi:hypothetical protein